MWDRLETGACDIGASDDRQYAGMFAGGLDIDRLDAGMGVRGAYEYGSGCAFDREVVRVAAAPADQAFVLFPAHGIADSCPLHPQVSSRAPAVTYNIPTALQKRGFGMAAGTTIPHHLDDSRYGTLEADGMLALYFTPGASSMAAHIALHEVGVPFESRPLSLTKGEQNAPTYRALNPEGKVPTLLIDGRSLTEVAAILYYLAKQFPDAGLLPRDIEGEAQAISWVSFIASTLHPARRQGLDHVKAVWKIADQRLGPKDWALPNYSIADIHVFRLYWRLVRSVKLEPGAYPNLSAHYDRMMRRPAVRRTIEIESGLGYELPDFPTS
jgi:glutathione S-transferase